MIVKTKPFQWPLTSLHSKAKPKPFTNKILGCPLFSFGLYLCYFDDTRNATNVHEILYFPFLDHVLPYNYYMLTNVLWFFLL